MCVYIYISTILHISNNCKNVKYTLYYIIYYINLAEQLIIMMMAESDEHFLGVNLFDVVKLI